MHRRGQRDPDAPDPGTSSTGAEASPPRPGTSRRQLLRGAGVAAALGAVGAGSLAGWKLAPPEADPRTVIPLWSGTVAYDARGTRILVGGRGVPLDVLPGTRLAVDLPDSSPVRRRAHRFDEGTAAWRERLTEALPQEPLLQDLAASALQDLWVLGDALPAPVAGWSPSWQHIWPRDAAFCAVALARVGHLDRAVDVLAHLQSLQARDGWFEARYDPGTDRAPDRRQRQFDGIGLLLWATAEVAAAAGRAGGDRQEIVTQRLTTLVTVSVDALRSSTQDGAGMPPVSPDYWERREHSVTLWTMAATLMGLRAGASLTEDPEVHLAAKTFTLLLEGTFGRGGYQRYRAGGGADSARALLDASGCHGVVPSGQLAALRHELARPGGGIAPGASWRADGVSWTPSTSLLGLALARTGEHAAAMGILRWLAEHRTAAGSLPEKVLFDGRPAEVAPLAWTAANVLLTLDALLRR
ncbi:twin-arginine translocation signal domain-containing protein [Brachybacterium avium]|uniref:twin-arginine translocation signal domain-containing protein n=1 Tax=Brachybacterium avium TaxID=2017485 RepID=UPI0012FD90F8|nr:twin-arginine translocation signal domain-containing protein [Brachybacterium avium]